MNYTQKLAGLRIRHFAPLEVTRLAYNTVEGVTNGLPPAEYEDNIIETLWALDAFRHRIGRPVTLTSAYRSPAYNAACGGTRNSYHMQNRALDFKVSGMSVFSAAEILTEMRLAGLFSGGIGVYSDRPTDQRFIHIDTRGYDVNWSQK